MCQDFTSYKEYVADCKKFVEAFLRDNPNAIIQYIRVGRGRRRTPQQPRRKPIGVVVAFQGMQGEILIGWSLYARKKETVHRYNKYVAIRKAIERQSKFGHTSVISVPQTAQRVYERVMLRSSRAFASKG